MNFKTEVNFNAGKLVKLNNPEFTLENKNNRLEFFVKVKDKDDEYALNFKTKAPLDDLFTLKVGEKVDFKKYLNSYIIFWFKGFPEPDPKLKMFITRYVQNGFIVDINLNYEDFFASIELVFFIEK